MRQLQAIFGNSYLHINAGSYLSLRFHRALSFAIERLYAQVLLDPLKEPLHLRAQVVQLRNPLRCEAKIVDHQRDMFAALVVDHYQIERHAFAVLLREGNANQMLRQIGVDLLLACLIRIGQCIARNRSATET